MNGPKNTLNFSEARKKLGELLLIYAIGITLCRLVGPSIRFISLVDWLIFRKDVIAGSAFALIKKFPLSRLPYFLMPFAALFWMKRKRSRAGLFFVLGMSGIGIVNHVGGLLVYLYYGMFFWGRLALPSLRVLIVLGLAVGFAFLSRKMFQLAQLLYTQENGTKGGIARGIALLALLFCFAAPFVNYERIAQGTGTLFKPYENVTLLKQGADIYFMDDSPGGKLLAIGAKDGVSVWDVESRRCVWSDDSMVSVQRVRFSPSGKYLAAAGRGAPEGSSDLAVFEVDGFRRLPGFDWPEEDLRKEKTFHDLAFRPDEKNLLAAWHRDWDWDQMEGGPNGAQTVAIRQQEREERFKKNPSAQGRDLTFFCTELSTTSGEIRETRIIKDLDEFYDLLTNGGIYFSPDASYLLYPRWYNRSNYVARHRVYRVNTNTWTEEEIWLDVKYSMLTAVGQDNHYEWQFTRDGNTAYLLAAEVGESGWNDHAFVVLKMNMTTKETKELRRVRVTRSFERNPWNRIALSPDEKRIALLGFGETLYDYGGGKEKIVTLRIWDLETDKTQRFVYKHNGGLRGNRNIVAWRILWLSQETLAISMSDRGGFFFVDIGEEKQ